MRRVPGGPIHLRPAAELAERVLLPGDPHRALHVAQALLDKPLMFNHHRGLWGYTGTARDGRPLTVQATGMGGPSAAIVVEELIELGARTLLRIGTAGAFADGLELGALVPADPVIPADGASASLGASDRVRSDPGLLACLADAARRQPVTAVSTDLFYDAREEVQARWAADGAALVEMEAAAVLRVAELRGARAACLLAVSDLVRDERERERAPAEQVEAMGLALGETAWAALELLAVRDG